MSRKGDEFLYPPISPLPYHDRHEFPSSPEQFRYPPQSPLPLHEGHESPTSPKHFSDLPRSPLPLHKGHGFPSPQNTSVIACHTKGNRNINPQESPGTRDLGQGHLINHRGHHTIGNTGHHTDT